MKFKAREVLQSGAYYGVCEHLQNKRNAKIRLLFAFNLPRNSLCIGHTKAVCNPNLTLSNTCRRLHTEEIWRCHRL